MNIKNENKLEKCYDGATKKYGYLDGDARRRSAVVPHVVCRREPATRRISSFYDYLFDG